MQSAQPASAPVAQKPFLMPTPNTAPISLFGGNLTPKAAAATPTVLASPFSVASLTATASLIKSEPQTTPAPAALEYTAPAPQKTVQVVAPEAKKEVVSEPVLSEESFVAASTAVMKLFSEELSTSLRQSSDASFTVCIHILSG